MSPAARDAVVFDMDGVLVDSEPLHLRAWQAALRECGLEKPDSFFLDWIGVPDLDLDSRLERLYPRPAGLASGSYLARKRGHYERIVRAEVAPDPALFTALSRLRVLHPLGVATSSQRPELELLLGQAGLLSLFDATVAYGETVAHKPDPAPYLRAAALLGVDPARCAAVEDSPRGLRAARAAGMTVLGVASSHPASFLAEADQVFATTREACEWLLDPEDACAAAEGREA